MKYHLTFFITLYALTAIGQKDSLPKVSFSGYGEFYYSYDFSEPSNHEKPGFLYNHKRHNEISINLMMLKANYSEKDFRANVALMAGNYPQYNLSTEPTWAQFIYEANVGFKLARNKNIWIDIGIMPSHIGFETAIGADCWTLSRSLLAENSPYYETGVKLTYTSNDEKLSLSALILNGWQRIQKPDFLQKLSFGFQASYKPSPKLMLNYSNFIGSARPDSLHSFRHFHNFYLLWEPITNFGITAGLDIGFENVLNQEFNTWYSPVVILKQRTSKKTSVSLRGEYYNDGNELIIETATPNGFRTIGFSSNFDYEINNRAKWRFEGKMYHSRDKIFSDNTNNKNYSLTTSLCLRI